MHSAWPAPIAEQRVHATVSVPGSKSETNRVLLLAALSDGPSTVRGGLDARDTRLMRAALRQLGVQIDDSGDEWHITPPRQLHGDGIIDCGLAGTVMRFVPPLAAISEGAILFDGDEAARTRPMRPLIDALADMGAVIDDAESLPFAVLGRPDLPGGAIRIDSSTSSQYISGLLLAGARYVRGVDIQHVGPTLPSRPHIDMTVAMLRERGVVIDDSHPDRWIVAPGPIRAMDTVVEPDLSNAAPFLAAAAVTGGSVTVTDWPAETHQPGDLLREILTRFGAEVVLDERGLTVTGGHRLHGAGELDLTAASELTPVVVAIAALADGNTRITGVGHIRGHETDRLQALHVELNELGGHVIENNDGLSVHARLLHGGEFRSYDDHRMAHCAAVLGLVVDGITIDDIGSTSKTMPDFPQRWLDMLAQSEQWLKAEAAAEQAAEDAAEAPEGSR
ncbi:MAG: 3-phosphoshikimate 1-carboxyvinyltransferase [Propionibacterium sp.]|nr:3-phosphoshikimate 1-carboxyvinyltransferase [Propionibacterium sp.]